jgi:hypothetical protein
MTLSDKDMKSREYVSVRTADFSAKYSDNDIEETSENKVSRRIFGHKQEEIKAQYRNLHVHEIYNLYLCLILVMKSRRKKREKHTKIINLCKKRRGHEEDLSKDSRIIPKWILQKQDVKLRTGLDWT